MEWYVANHLINYEKGMSNEEIYTAKVGGYVNVRVETQGSSGLNGSTIEKFVQVKDQFGKKEKMLKRFIIAFTILYVGFSIAIDFLKNINYFWMLPEIAQMVCSIIIQTWIFRNLYLNMKNNHLYEFMI